MKKLLTFTLLAAVFASGCCSTKICNEGGRTMCIVSNYGWRLWDLIPVAAGYLDKKDRPGTIWFMDTITLETNQRLLDIAIREQGAIGTKSLDSYMTDEQTLFTFYRRTYYTSAELIFEEKK